MVSILMPEHDLKWARLDTLIGAVFTVLVAGAMMLVGNYGFEHKIAFQDRRSLRWHSDQLPADSCGTASCY